MPFKNQVDEQRVEINKTLHRHSGVLFTILILLGLILLGQTIWGLLS